MKNSFRSLSALLFLSAAFAVNAQHADVSSLLSKAAFKHLTPADVAEMELQRSVRNAGLGVTHHYFQQRVNGIQVKDAVAAVHVNEAGVVAFKSESLVGDAKSKTNAAQTLVAPEEALSAAAEALEYGVDAFGAAPVFKRSESGVLELLDARYSNEALQIHPIYLLRNQMLELHWKLIWHLPNGSHLYSVYVDALSGNVTEIVDETLHCDFGTPEPSFGTMPDPFAHTKSEMATAGTAQYYVLPIPFESPNHGSFALLDDPSDSLASPYGWHDLDGVDGHDAMITRGNNVFAKEDKDANNSGGYSPNGGSSLLFDFPFVNEKRDGLYEDAAIVNLFYSNNMMHDVWYHYGFDEESGNFQQNNYGRGGAAARGNDAVQADARDGSGTNNANFSTPADGTPGRMQMFLWTTGSATDLLQVLSPPAAEGSYSAARAAFGPRIGLTPYTGDLVLVNDGSANPELGCAALTNGAAVNGKIAVVRRGSCNFVNKVQNAQNAGAIAVIVVNNQAGAATDMGGSSSSITIPSLHISQEDGQKIIDVMAKETVRASIYDSSSTNSNVFDSDFDNGIIAHEYGHGISNRLTGGPANTGCLGNQEQAGEGWSDFFALAMTHRPGDGPNTPRGIGTYVRNQPTSGRGIRPYPYTRNMSTNPVIYDNIRTFSVPHGVGSVWCSMVWDLYWNLIDVYGYDADLYRGTGGNNMCMQLVMDGLKLQPCNPGFTDSRDAILLADRLRYNGKHQKLIWETFARRGLGYSASQGESNNRSDGTQGFDIPPFLLNQLVIDKKAPERVMAGTWFEYELQTVNQTENTMYKVRITDTLHTGLSVDMASLPAGTRFENGVVLIERDSLRAGDTLRSIFRVAVMNPSTYTSLVFSDDVESDVHAWETSGNSGTIAWKRDLMNKYSGVYSWFIPNLPSQSDQSLLHRFRINQENPALLFRHWYQTEDGWDGGVLELREKDDTNWIDLRNAFVLNGYDKSIKTNPASNISGRSAFSGDSKGWIKSVIDLSDWKGKEVDIRFRFVSDGAAGGTGWYVDDVELADLFAIPNQAHSNGDGLIPAKSNEVLTVIDLNPALSAESHTFDNDLSVYPNPIKNVLIIEQRRADGSSFVLVDMLGRTIKEGKLNEDRMTLSTGDLSAGTYVLRVFTLTGVQSFKLIKH